MDTFKVKKYGILGRSNKERRVDPPDEDTVLVDPAGLPFIQGDKGPCDAKGAAQANYKWLEISEDESFPPEVKTAIKGECDAKYHAYAGGTKKCIHVVGPDLRKVQVENEAVDKLAMAYCNVFQQFVEQSNHHGLKTMRLLPISGGVFSGAFKTKLPEITARAVQKAFDQLNDQQKRHIKGCSIEMCIFMESEFGEFDSEFNKLKKRDRFVEGPAAAIDSTLRNQLKKPAMLTGLPRKEQCPKPPPCTYNHVGADTGDDTSSGDEGESTTESCWDLFSQWFWDPFKVCKGNHADSADSDTDGETMSLQ